MPVITAIAGTACFSALTAIFWANPLRIKPPSLADKDLRPEGVRLKQST